jgi:hypothetical protein
MACFPLYSFFFFGIFFFVRKSFVDSIQLIMLNHDTCQKIIHWLVNYLKNKTMHVKIKIRNKFKNPNQ